MTTSPTPYLQTLPQDEAIAFVTSLQKVKTHLSHELAWMSQQVEQKTVQFHGIETLLSEAVTFGLVAAPAALMETAMAEPAAAMAIAGGDTNGGSAAAVAAVPPVSPTSASNGDAAPTPSKPSTAAKPSTDSKPSTTSSVSPPPPAKTRRNVKRGPQPATRKGGAASKAKPTASRKTSQPAKASTQPFVRSQFQDQSITDAIGDILQRSRAPLSADEIMTILYEGLSDDAYKRAKNSVTNILSVGRAKGKWKSTGRGLYANNTVAGA